MADVAVDKRLHSPHSGIDKKDSAYKRSNKPYMEKKRRARINNCLTQLKTLVLQAMRKDTNQYSKLEKADILEMTVKHLRQLQRQQVSHAMSHDPSVMTKYKAGFTECANEVMRYLGSVQNIDEDVRGRLVNHLGNVVTQINTQTIETQQCAQPLNVQIPQNLNQGLNSVPTGCLLMPAGVQTSPIVLQQQQIQNIPNVYSHGHNNQSLPLTHQSSQQQQQRLVGNGTQFSGSFQIVPTSSPNSAVAVYLGQTPCVQQSTKSSSPPAPNSSLPPYPSHTPPRTKASLKAFDSSAFTHVSSGSDKSNNSSPSCSPTSSDMSYMKTNLDLHMHGISVNCGRTPSPLKGEDVWRPW